MFFLDVQGTLISDADKSLIFGAKELIDFLNTNNLAYVIITNNTKKLDFLEILRQKGLNIKDNAYLDPFCILKTLFKPCKVAAFGANEFLQSLEMLGFKLDFKNPELVLIASFDDFKFNDFASIIEMIKNGVKVVAMHESSIYKKDDKSYPGVGSIMAMLKNAIHFEYDVMGKPSVIFYNEALKLLKMQNQNARFEDIKIISDDLKGDLLKAKELNMKTYLVLSGKLNNIKGINTSFLDGVYPSVFEILREEQCLI
ncbi:HAD-IIA family hydrolase [Campylobacter taeniopygiae]|uniref:HAD-IIA family hydrolase n=1 Tax=Campylobacter taeniopygiae TaxID=2510188 RepID=UPI003D6B57C7